MMASLNGIPGWFSSVPEGITMSYQVKKVIMPTYNLHTAFSPSGRFFCKSAKRRFCRPEKVGKVARIGGGVWVIRAMPELKSFFRFDVFPYVCIGVGYIYITACTVFVLQGAK